MDARRSSHRNCILRFVVCAFLILQATSVALAAPDYLQLQQLYAFLDSKPQLAANKASGPKQDQTRLAFADVKSFRVSEADAKRHAALSKQDKLEAIKWLTDFSSEQALLDRSVVKGMVQQLRESTESNAQHWHRQIVSVRVLAATEEWKITNAWLTQFWKVQAMYKDDEVKRFQEKIQGLTPMGVAVVMEHVMGVLGNRVQQRAAPRRPLQMVAPTPQAQRYTSGAPSGFVPQRTPTTPRRSRTLGGGEISRRVSDFYIYRGSLLY